MKTVGVIRNRGQLTIPDAFRKLVPWVGPMSAVTISLVKPDKIVIKPHQPKIDWSDLWKRIHHSRSFLGKGKESAIETLEKDRLSR